MAQAKLIFGFGSLISTASVMTTVPDATDFRPAFAEGFCRDFSVWDPEGYTETHLEFAGEPFCALDVKKATTAQARVNGVVFSMSEEHFSQLLRREREYKLIKTIVFDYVSGEPIGTALLFSSGKNNGAYDFNSAAQAKYLQECLASAKQYGEKFFNEFVGTTFINGKNLREYPHLLDFGQNLLRNL